MVVLGFLSGRVVSGAVWDSVLPLARGIADPKMDIGYRLKRMQDMFLLLDHMDSTSKVVYVKADASGQENGTSWRNAFHSVQQAIDALILTEGWVWVAQGTYRERIILKSGVILLGGFKGDELDTGDRNASFYNTTLYGNGKDPAVTLEHKTLIDGFTIVNGGPGQYNGGGGILCGDWLSIIRNNVIKNNAVDWAGGGIFVYGGTDDSSPVMDKAGYSPVLYGNLIFHNSAKCGDGICLRASTAMMAHNTVVNHQKRGIEVITTQTEKESVPTLVNSIVYHNGDDVYNQFDQQGRVHGMAIVKYSCFTRWATGEEGEGAIYANPLFADSANGDFSLLPASPCIDSGFPSGPGDLDGSRADLGSRFFRRHHVTQGVTVQFLALPDDPMPIQVDGMLYFTPFQLSLSPESSHSIKAALVRETNPDSRYYFESWSNNGNRTQVLKTPVDNTELSARYVLQHFLKLEGNGLGILPLGEGWYREGSRVSLFVDSLVEIDPWKRHRFCGWIGSGSGSVSSKNVDITLTMNGPIIEQTKWVVQYPLHIQIDSVLSNSVSVTAIPDHHWHDSGDSVLLAAKSTDPLIRFTGWKGDIKSAKNSIWIVMSSPMSITASFEKISVGSHPPNPFDLIFPDSGSLVQISGNSIRFLWRRASDPDSADTITYDLFFSTSTDFENHIFSQVSAGEDTSLSIPYWQTGGGIFYWGVKAKDKQGHSVWCASFYKMDIQTLAADRFTSDFVKSNLNPSYPNPFNSSTLLSYRLSKPETVKLQILDLSGKTVRNLVRERQNEGSHFINWDSKDDKGSNLPSGTYFIKIVLDDKTFIQKLTLLK